MCASRSFQANVGFSKLSCSALQSQFQIQIQFRLSDAMALTDNERRSYLSAHVSTDLQFAWSDSNVSLAAQYNLAQHYKTLRVFASMADSKADLRTALRTDYAMDQNASPEMRADVAKIVTSWELSRELSKKEQELRAEAKVLGMPRTIQHSERQAMIKAVEQTIGKLQESETPSNEYLATKVEECENNEPVALPLDEVTSKFDATTSSLQSSLDAGGHLRVVKTKSKGKLPENTETLRKMLKLEGITWLCMAAKFRTKPWLHGLTLNDWLKYTDYVLGDKVFGLKIQLDGQSHAVKPPWTVLLTYEHRLRKEAFKLIMAGTHSMSEALAHVVKDADIKECYFTTPIALGIGSMSHQSDENKWRRLSGKGFGGQKGGNPGGKSKGKSAKGKQRTQTDFNGNTLVSKTPDGRELCYAFNAQGCAGKCGRVHACRVRGCYGKHSAREHSKYAQDSTPGDGNKQAE